MSKEKEQCRYPMLNFREELLQKAEKLVSPEMANLIRGALDGLEAILKWEKENPEFLWKAPQQTKKVEELGNSRLSIVTGADERSQEAILRSLSNTMPNSYVICEEKVKGLKGFNLKICTPENYLEAFKAGQTAIVIDPMDGTTNYMLGGCDWTITLGLVLNGKHICGLVLNPVKGVLVFGGRGSGVFVYNCGEVEMLVPIGLNSLAARTPIKTLVYAQGYDFQLKDVRKRFEPVLEKMGAVCKCLMTAYSCANTLLDLLMGRGSLVFIPRQSPWDYSGALPLLYELGLSVVFFTFEEGKPITTHHVFKPDFANPGKRVAGLLIGNDERKIREMEEILIIC